MKVMTILGTRPEIIKFNLIGKVLDQHCEHTLVHTGEDSDESLSDIFFRDLEVRAPDVDLRAAILEDNSQEQLSAKITTAVAQHSPDRIFIMGGSDSSRAAAAAVHGEIPIYRLDAGRRCFDETIPDDTYFRSIDHASRVLMSYTHSSAQTLIREGIGPARIFVTGSPTKEVLENFESRIEASAITKALSVKPFDYFLATVHRPQNIDDTNRLAAVLKGFEALADKFGKSVLVASHPRMARRLEQYELRPSSSKVRLLRALNFFDFVKLEKNALAVLTDSSTVQEECSILRVPNITLRESTDRLETMACGSNLLCGADVDAMLRGVELSIAQPAAWSPPPEYDMSNVSQAVSKILLSHSGNI